MTAITHDRIREAIKAAGGNKTNAAKELGCTRSWLWRELKKIGDVEESDFHRQIRQAEKKISDLQSQLENESKRRESAEKDLHDITAASKALQESSNFEHFKIKERRPQKGRSPATAVLLASDWHAEANVDPEVVSNLNSFNLETCRKRVDRLFGKSVYLTQFANNICDIEDMVVWLGGDLINGYIHEELQEGNFLGPAEACIFISELVSGGIDYILNSGCVKRIHVVTSVGNHGRSTHRTRVSTGYRSSWEYLAYNNLQSAYRKTKEITWQIGKGYHSIVDIQGHRCRFHHGDSIKYNGGVGGITIPVNKAIAAWNVATPAKYDFFGHYHQFIDNWCWTCNGSLVGYDAYALSIKAAYQPPTQTFCVIDQERGKTMALPIFLE